MSVSDGFREYALEQLGRVQPVTARPMFGGIGLYSRGLFFALIDDDVLYFKVDDETRDTFRAAGMSPFRPFADRPDQVMQYYEVPPDALDDTDVLGVWLGRALGAATRARRRKKR